MRCWLTTSTWNMTVVLQDDTAEIVGKGGVCLLIISGMLMNSIGTTTRDSAPQMLCQRGVVTASLSSTQTTKFTITTTRVGGLAAAELWRKKQVFHPSMTSKLVKTTRIRTQTKIVGQWSIKSSTTRYNTGRRWKRNKKT